MRRRLLDRLPPVLQPILELRQIADTAEQPEFDALWQALETLLSNQFVETADESGIARFERVLGITPRAARGLILNCPQTSSPVSHLSMRPVSLLRLRDRKSTRLNSSHSAKSRMPSSA